MLNRHAVDPMVIESEDNTQNNANRPASNATSFVEYSPTNHAARSFFGARTEESMQVENNEPRSPRNYGAPR